MRRRTWLAVGAALTVGLGLVLYLVLGSGTEDPLNRGALLQATQRINYCAGPEGVPAGGQQDIAVEPVASAAPTVPGIGDVEVTVTTYSCPGEGQAGLGSILDFKDPAVVSGLPVADK